MVEMNKIHNVDCLEFMKQVPDNYFDLVLTDPPYGLTRNKWDKKIDLKVWWKQISRITKDSSAIIIFSVQPFTTELIQSNIKSFRYSLIWDKVLPVGFLNANRMPLRKHEEINIFYRSLPFYNPEKTQGHERKQVVSRNNRNNKNYGNFKNVGGYDSTERFPTSILKFSTGGTRTKIIHPTQKPLELIIYLLKLYAKKGIVAFDPFMGSGTMAEACISLGLDWCGCELEAEHVEKANKRLEKVQGVLL